MIAGKRRGYATNDVPRGCENSWGQRALIENSL